MQPDRVYDLPDGSAVEWRAPLCVHCKNCLTGLPSVFDLNRKPWVNVNGATVEQIKEQVAECPSGALVVRS